MVLKLLPGPESLRKDFNGSSCPVKAENDLLEVINDPNILAHVKLSTTICMCFF